MRQAAALRTSQQESLARVWVRALRTSGTQQESAWIQDFAQQALQARQQGLRGEGRLRVLARGHGVLEAQGQVIGIPTACVLWVSTGDPRQYHAAAAYRKAMGLNLVERSRSEERRVGKECRCGWTR